MVIQDLRELLENTEDKLSIFQDKDKLNQYDISVAEFIDLIKDFFSDEEKAKILKIEHIKKLSSYVRKTIINTVVDDNIKLDLIKNDDVISNMDDWHIKELVESLGENGKIEILKDSNFLQKHGIEDFQIKKIILTLNDENKVALLSNIDLIEKQLKMKDYTIKDIVAGLEDEKIKLNMIENYKFESYLSKDIIQTFSTEGMKDVLLENKYNFNNYDIISLIASMNTNSLIEFINENKEFISQNNVSPYRIINQLDSQKQIEFMSVFEDVELTIRRKKTNFSNLKGRNKEEY